MSRQTLIIVGLLGVCIAFVVGIKTPQPENTKVSKSQVMTQPDNPADLERKTKMEEFKKILKAFHQQEEYLRAELKAAKESKNQEAIIEAKNKLEAMMKEHNQEIKQERNRLGLPKNPRERREKLRIQESSQALNEPAGQQ